MVMLESVPNFFGSNIYMTPPNDGIGSDENSGAEDSLSVGNLSRRQLNAECTATFETAGCVKVILDNEQVADDDSRTKSPSNIKPESRHASPLTIVGENKRHA